MRLTIIEEKKTRSTCSTIKTGQQREYRDKGSILFLNLKGFNMINPTVRKESLIKKAARHVIVCAMLLNFFSFGCSGSDLNEKTPAGYVNPFIGTDHPRWILFSSASRPFGMVNLSPDTDTEGTWGSGYVYPKKKIRCFSHIHGYQLAGVAVMPATGEMRGHLGMDVYQSSFSHDGEVAEPGYHKVFLEDYQVQAELTSTTRVGFHRYTFPAGDQSHIIFDTGAFLAHGPTIYSKVWKVDDDEIAGYEVREKTRWRHKDLTVYFVARLNKPADGFTCWREGKLRDKDADGAEGVGAGAAVSFKTSEGEQVLMKVAISYTSVENARKNLEEELAHWDFDRVRQESFDEWNGLLGRIKVKGGTEEQKVRFYTDLWHVLLGRRIISDADGKYPDLTGEKPVIRQVRLNTKGQPVYPHYNFDALWGTHWSLNILWSIAYPEIMSGFCNTMVDMYQNGGMIPRSASGGTYSFVMMGDPAASFFATAYNKGIRDYETEKAYEGLRKNAFPGGLRDYATSDPNDTTRGGMVYYIGRGYVPVERKTFDGVSLTLQYAYQDWCLAQMAKTMGKEKDYRLFMKRSLNYRNVWNPETKYMHPRIEDGSYTKEFKPIGEKQEDKLLSHWGFCESNAAIDSYYVPHDMAGLISLFGGQEVFSARLNEQFEKARPYRFLYQPDFSAWVDYTNQSSTGMAHLFNYAGKPWLTQKWVREVKEELFTDTTALDGYQGDEDQGQMGALGVLMSIGLFEVDGGAHAKPYYEITSPIFDEVEITLHPDYYPGKVFTIITRNNLAENRYIRSARLNGKEWNRCWFPHEVLANGGTLELELGPSPNEQWGTEPPPSAVEIEKN